MKESPELLALELSIIEAINKGDADMLVAASSRQPGTLTIGTDADDWVEGAEAIERLWREQAGQFEIRAGDTKAYEHGDVGWTAGTVTWVLPDGSELTGRVTAVAVRKDDGWKLVQSHASVPRSV